MAKGRVEEEVNEERCKESGHKKENGAMKGRFGVDEWQSQVKFWRSRVEER